MVSSNGSKSTQNKSRRGSQQFGEAMASKARRQDISKTPAQKADSSVAVATLTHEQIAGRAKAIWRQRGCKAGFDEQNWYEAEAQLKKEFGI